MSLKYTCIDAQLSRLCVPFSEKLDSFLDCLDNRRTMHDSQNEALEWARGNQNNTHNCSNVTLHGL
jgi:hypothetical protein